MTRIIFRPLPAWTDPVTHPRQGHRFKAAWSDTVDILKREVEHLCDVWNPDVILQVQADEAALRRDGGIRADAKVRDPGIIVSFDSRHGPLRYACDTFESHYWGDMPGWQANVRAVALGLQALRTVDRYGITARGEQYVGFTALPASEEDARMMTVDQAVEFILRFRNHSAEFNERDLRRTAVRTVLYRRAAAKLHPDRNGDAAEFRMLSDARRLLTEAWG
jgi:hypothetical protein